MTYNPEGPSKEGSFEAQFKRESKLATEDGDINFVDLFPEKLKAKTPLILAPGWGESFQTFKDPLRILFDSGRRVLCLRYLSLSFHGESHLPEEERFALEEVAKARALRSLLESQIQGQIDLVAHSEGAINSVIYAISGPEKIRSLILVNPAGLIGDDSFLSLAGRFAKNVGGAVLESITDKKAREAFLRSEKETLRYISNNLSRALNEAGAIADTQIEQSLVSLKKSGVKIFVLHNVGDPVFPMNKVQRIVKKDMVDGFYSIRGAHNEIYTHPETYIMLIEEILRKIDEVTKKDGETESHNF